MNIEILKTVTARFDLPQSDKQILLDAMEILDSCAYDCRSQAELTEDSSSKAILIDCAEDFESVACQIENICFKIKDGVQV